MKIAVLGTGTWAIALSSVLLYNNHHVIMYGRDKNQIDDLKNTGINHRYFPNYKLCGDIEYSDNLEETVSNVDFILNTIPTQGIRNTFINKPKILDSTIIINASKGLEIDTLSTISQIFKEIYPENIYSVLSGPSHAEEVIIKTPTALVAACKNLKISEKIQDLFMNDYIRVYSSDDVIGVEISGALKNVIAICNGISIGMNYGDNTQAALISRGIVEIKRLGIAMGAKSETFDGLTGVGDLIVTCMSEYSRNRKFGKLLGEGLDIESAKKEVGMVVEGVYTAIAANKLSKKYNVDMPIQEALYNVMYNNLSPKEALLSLIQRKKRHEIE